MAPAQSATVVSTTDGRALPACGPLPATGDRGPGRGWLAVGRGATADHAEHGTYLDEEVADAPQAVGDAGLALPQPVVVGNADVVHVPEERVFPGKDQLVQALRARLLHALQAEPEVDGYLLCRERVSGALSLLS